VFDEKFCILAGFVVFGLCLNTHPEAVNERILRHQAKGMTDRLHLTVQNLHPLSIVCFFINSGLFDGFLFVIYKMEKDG
jgi:hypothetical protein